MGRRVAVVVTAAAALAGFATPAPAATICVATSSPDCTAPIEGDLQVALTRAMTAPGADTVLIGPGDFTTAAAGGFVYAAADPIEIRGAGSGQTLLRSTNASPQQVLRVSPGAAAIATSRVADLEVNAAALANGGAALQAAADIEDVEATAISTENAASYAISVVGEGATARRVVVDSAGPFAVGVALAAPGATLEDSDVRARRGVEISGGAALPARVVRRTRIAGSQLGVEVCNAPGFVENSSIEIIGATTGIEVAGSSRCGSTSSTFVGRHLTIFQRVPDPAGSGIAVSGNTTDPVATLTDSVFAGLATTIVAAPLAGRTSTLTLARLAEPVGLRNFGGAGSLVVDDQGGHVSADPLLVDRLAGDLRLGSGSPAIDAGATGGLDAGESATDLAGTPRLLDGDGDGLVRRDLGALEAPTVVIPGVPVLPTLPGSPAAPAPRALDKQRPVLRRVRLNRAKRRISLRVSEASTLRIQLRALSDGCRKPSRECRERIVARQVKRLGKGLNTIKLKRALSRRLAGARRLVLRATDAAGNRSKSASIALRLPRRS